MEGEEGDDEEGSRRWRVIVVVKEVDVRDRRTEGRAIIEPG